MPPCKRQRTAESSGSDARGGAGCRWSELPADVLRSVLEALRPDALSILRVSRVCRAWWREASAVLREGGLELGTASLQPRRANQACAYASTRLPLLTALDVAGCSITNESLLAVARGCSVLERVNLSACRHLSSGALETFLRLRGGGLRSLSLARLRLSYLPLLDVMASACSSRPLPLEELDLSGSSGVLLRSPIGGSAHASAIAPRLRRVSLTGPPGSGRGDAYVVPLAALAGLPLESLHWGPAPAPAIEAVLPSHAPPPGHAHPALSLVRISLLVPRETPLEGGSLEALLAVPLPRLEALRLSFVSPSDAALTPLRRLPTACPALRALVLELSAGAPHWLAPLAEAAAALPLLAYALLFGVGGTPPQQEAALEPLRARFPSLRGARSRYPHERGYVCGDPSKADGAGGRLAQPEDDRLGGYALSVDDVAWRPPGALDRPL
eukprot:tig00020538_g10382.t1